MPCLPDGVRSTHVFVKSFLTKRIEEFTLDPSGAYGRWRQDQDDPVATAQRSADRVVPLLPASDACLAVPERHSMATQHGHQSFHECPIRTGVRDERLSGHGPTALFSTHNTSACTGVSGLPDRFTSRSASPSLRRQGQDRHPRLPRHPQVPRCTECLEPDRVVGAHEPPHARGLGVGVRG